MLGASTAAYPTKALELLDLLQVVTHEHLPKWKRTSHIQIGLDIAGSGLDESSRAGAVSGNYNLISDMVSQYILVAGKDVDGLDVEVEKVGRPRGGASVYKSGLSSRNLRPLVKHPPIDPLTGSDRSILNAEKPEVVS